VLPGDPAAKRAGQDPEGERQSAEYPRRPLPEAVLAVQERHDPVADDDTQPERRRIHHGQPVEPAVTQDALDRLLAPRAREIASPRAEKQDSDQGDRGGRDERCPPADRLLDLRNDREREAAARDPDAAIDPLRRSGSPDRSHVSAPGDEAEPGSDTGQRAHRDGECNRGRRQSDHVEEGDEGEAEETRAARTETIRRLSARDLHCQVGDEEGGGEEADGREAHAISVCDLLCDGADVRDVPAGRKPEGTRAYEGTPHPRAYAISPPARRIARSRSVSRRASGSEPNGVRAFSSDRSRPSGISHSCPSSVRL
jgi:hypothetical protein